MEYKNRRNTITTGGTLLPHYFPALAVTSDHRSMYLYGKKMCWTVTPPVDCESRFFLCSGLVWGREILVAPSLAPCNIVVHRLEQRDSKVGAKQGFGYIESNDIREVTPTRQNCDQTQWKGLNINSDIFVNMEVFNRRFVTQFPKVALDYDFDLSRYCPTRKFYFHLLCLDTFLIVFKIHISFMLDRNLQTVFHAGALQCESNYVLWGYFGYRSDWHCNLSLTDTSVAAVLATVFPHRVHPCLRDFHVTPTMQVKHPQCKQSHP